MDDKHLNVAVVGATGAVGEVMIAMLEERRFPVARLHPLASRRSAGREVAFRGRIRRVEALEEFEFSDVGIALFSAGSAVAGEHAPRAAAAGCTVVDNSSCFRYEPDVPLVVPEVNPGALDGFRKRGIVANPNCSTIQLVVALKPLHDAFGVERVNVATYQAVSGTGREAIDELAAQSAARLEGKPVESEVYPIQIAFNALPHCDEFLANGYTREEMKIVWETRKILGDERIRVNVTAVRVPVYFGHSEAVHIETREKANVEEVKRLLEATPGVTVVDGRTDAAYPTAATHAAGADDVFVGRIREDISHPRGLNLWVVSDNLRKGAALNSVQIAEVLVRDHLGSYKGPKAA